jgi:hypothetical protein
MVDFAKFTQTKNGRIIMSILLGLGLSSLFRKSCKNRNCIVFKAPSIKEIKDKTFEFNNKCYKYNETNIKCDSNRKTVNFS